MLTGLDPLLIGDPLLAIALLVVPTLRIGKVINKVLLLVLVPNQNVMPLLLLHVNCCRYIILMRLDSRVHCLWNYGVTIRLFFILPLILFFMKEQIILRLIAILYAKRFKRGLLSVVRTGEQLANIFTKTLNKDRIYYICNKLNMINIYTLAWGGSVKRIVILGIMYYWAGSILLVFTESIS